MMNKNKKLIIYALGQVFRKNLELIPWENVVAISDKGAEDGITYREFKAVAPEDISAFKYDHIVVFSNQYFEQIREELCGIYGLPDEKILYWKRLFNHEKGDRFRLYTLLLKKNKCKNVLDLGAQLLTYCLNKEELNNVDLRLDAYLPGAGETAAESVNLYDGYFSGGEINRKYDVILIRELSEETINILNKLKHSVKTIYYIADQYDKKDKVERILSEYGEAFFVRSVNEEYWYVEAGGENENISIYQAVHKDYHLVKKKAYRPLCLGNYKHKGWLSEKTGDNISGLNPKINECTALYWIWKNTEEEYVGLNHYRRFFYQNDVRCRGNCLTGNEAVRLLMENDIIVAERIYTSGLTLIEQLEDTIDQDLARLVYEIFNKWISNKQPGYTEDYISVMNSYAFYPCNLFITKREILNRYCEWLFSFLLPAAEEINVEGYDSYSSRVTGFFAERMLTVWLRKNKLKIVELPYSRG